MDVKQELVDNQLPTGMTSIEEIFDNTTDNVLNTKQEEVFIKDELLVTSAADQNLLDRQVVCRVCEFRTTRKSDLVKHMKTHTVEKPYIKEIFDNTTDNVLNTKQEEVFIKDELLVTSAADQNLLDRQVVCRVCEFRTTRKSDLVKHMKTHTVEKPYIKEIFDNTTDNVLNTKQEEVFIKDELLVTSAADQNLLDRQFVCRVCEFRTTRKSDLVKHMKTHTGKKPYICSVCEYKTAYKSNLDSHMKRHTGDKPYLCSICEYKTAHKSTLVYHIKSHTGNKPYLCSICEYKASQKSDLVKHMKIHTGEKPYKYSICEYKTAQKGVLVRHMKTHIAEKPYSCSICEYKAAHKGSLIDHIKRHTGDKPYLCSICEYKASLKCDLAKHMKIHTEQKSYICSVCKYKTAYKSNLGSHMKRHTGDKPYLCPICEYKAVEKGALLRHMKTHTCEKPYSVSFVNIKQHKKVTSKTKYNLTVAVY